MLSHCRNKSEVRRSGGSSEPLQYVKQQDELPRDRGTAEDSEPSVHDPHPGDRQHCRQQPADSQQGQALRHS